MFWVYDVKEQLGRGRVGGWHEASDRARVEKLGQATAKSFLAGRGIYKEIGNQQLTVWSGDFEFWLEAE